MGNMSYCRFRNTQPDLADCIQALDEPMSADEAVYAERLVRLCIKVAQRYGQIDGPGALSDTPDYEPVTDDDDA